MGIDLYPELRFCRVKEKTKKPFEKDWVNKPYKWDELPNKENENYGVLCGYGNLAVIDSDDFELAEHIEKVLPETFTVETGSGGRHFYYFIPDLEEKIVLITKNGEEDKHWGEVQWRGTQVVGPGSIHPNGNFYKIIKNERIQIIDKDTLINALSPFMQEINQTEDLKRLECDMNSEIDNLRVTDIWGTSGLKFKNGEYFGEHPIHGSDGGCNFWINPSKNIWHCFRCKTGGGPLSAIAVKERIINCNDSLRGSLRGSKALEAIKIAKEKYGLKDNFEIKKEKTKEIEVIKKSNTLELWDYEDFENLKKDTNFLIQDVIYPKTVNMIYSPPGQFKSILCLNLAMSVAYGKEWLGFETKKYPVLYCDKENNDQIIKERLEGLYKGHNFNRKKFPLYILRRNGDLLDDKFNEKLKQTVKEKEIKLVLFDTLHRFADYDENRSDDLNRLYTKVFQPLVEDLGVSIIFLHHTTKAGGYRGSGDFLGMVDTAYAIFRNGKTNSFRIVNEKCRAGEIDNIVGEIDFGEDYIKIVRLNEQVESEKKVNRLKEVTSKIKEYLTSGTILRRKEILDKMELDDFDYGSIKTVDRCLRFLVDNGYLDKEEGGKYSKILR